MERLLHYIWKHKILPLKALVTTSGEELEIIDPGMHNHDQGPDFFNAKVRLGDTIWAGNVEIHLKSSDWYRHGHHQDTAYDNTILHVAGVVDCEVETSSGKRLPQVQLDVPASLAVYYQELCRTDDSPRCHRMIPHLDPLRVHSWMDALLAERMEERSRRVLDRVASTRGDWEQATFITLSRNFGFGLNGDPFERWARNIPLQAVAKHRDSLFQVEAFFLGMAGLIDELEGERGAQEVARLHQEFDFLHHKFQLPPPMHKSEWKYLRTRPSNFPHVRLQQIACLYHRGTVQLSRLLETTDIASLHHLLSLDGIAAGSRNLIIINTVVPLLYAYGTSHNDERFMERAIAMLEQLPHESNYIIRQWKACGLTIASAADSQALIQLKREYCDRLDCLRCRFGYEYLKYNK